MRVPFLNYIIFLIFSGCLLYGQLDYNHPELKWQTFETEHFQIHFYPATEGSAREGAIVAERIYPHVTGLYNHEPKEKTDLVFLDTDDFSNGMAFYYDNKIYIWVTPLDFILRGSHRWLQNVITHEFTHIVSLQAAMKAGLKIPAAYLQFMGYEKEKRKDVLYGYPNRIISYPIPGTVVPPWLAEGVAQFMYEGADWDLWDSHRDMILRDRVLNGKMLSLAEMNTFGKKGIGNESIYNSGYALTKYIAATYGHDKLRELMRELGRPLQFSINNSISNILDVSADTLYNDFKTVVEKRYHVLTESVREKKIEGRVICSNGSANLFPVWNPTGDKFAYISNQGNDYMSQTSLYIYDLDSGSEKKISNKVRHAASWHSSGEVIYYNKRGELPNRYGSSYFDIYEYDLKTEKETRLTKDTRSYSPVFISGDSAIAYISSYDGTQNIFYLNLKDRSVERLTNFKDRRSVYRLSYDVKAHRLLFDYSVHHFRDLGYLNLADTTLGNFINNALWDERDMTISHSGEIIYADDRSGIYNLYYIGPDNNRQGYLTNVLSGAFMPDISSAGKIVFSLYDELGYKIAILDSVALIDQFVVGYAPEFYRRNADLTDPILELDETEAVPYEDNFTTMFILPKLMLEYGTLKPGIYFYSSEVIERLSLFGQASINKSADLDLFLLFEFSRLYPTIYTEIIYLTRNKHEQNYYSVYPINDNLRFRLIQFRGGVKFPLLGFNAVDIFLTWQRYRAYVKQEVPSERLEVGVAYDYYRGSYLGFNWSGDLLKRRADSNINPSKGFAYNFNVTFEKNKFINDLDLSDAGTLVEEFKNNDLVRVEFDTDYHLEIPHTRRWTLSFEAAGGWLSNTEADSFFNFFGGGLPGLQGYPFYSIEGNRVLMGELVVRIPLLYLKNYPIGWFNLNNSTIGFVAQAGDAWKTPLGNIDPKRSVGLELRFNGFSFYNYPTAIGLEVHYGLDKFVRTIQGKNYDYGKEPRFYASILFGF